MNRIGEAEQERLGLFTEETGEANQIVGKILRHGLDSSHPEMPLLSNANLLELEAGHVLAAIDLLVACGTLSREALDQARREKLEKLRSWLHSGTNLDAVEELLKAEAPQSDRYLLKGWAFTASIDAVRAMIEDARASFRNAAEPLLSDANDDVKSFAVAVEKSVGDVSADEALEALRRFKEERAR